MVAITHITNWARQFYYGGHKVGVKINVKLKLIQIKCSFHINFIAPHNNIQNNNKLTSITDANIHTNIHMQTHTYKISS